MLAKGHASLRWIGQFGIEGARLSAADSTNQFQLYLPGLIKVLAEHLYSDPRVGLRELLQNSHDSISRRRVEQAGWGDEPRIEVRIGKEPGVIEVEDNGSGLTKDEVVTYLSTIGRGYTRELREELALTDPARYHELIGQFGLGFLSAFLLAEAVEVETRSFKPGNSAVAWRSEGSESYRLDTSKRRKVGTTVRLFLKPSMRFLTDEPTLDRLVRRFGDLLPHPIYVGKSAHRSNRGVAPWDEESVEDALVEFLRSREVHDQPIWVHRLTDHKIKIDHDAISVPLAGLIYIPNRSRASLQEHGDATIFIRNMFICDQNRKILPKWARFARGIIESPMLQPTASREEVHEDEHLQWVVEAIEEQFLTALDTLSRTDKPRWNQILEAHADLIMAWAAEDESFFNRVSDQIRLPTSRGRLTIPEYLKQTRSKTIYYQATDSPRLCEQVMLEGCGKPVIDASWFGVLPFLERYAAEHRQVKIVAADTDIASLVREVRDAKFDALKKVFKTHDVDVRVGEFQPAQLPAVLLFDEHAEFLRDASEAIKEDNLMPGIGEMLAGYLDELKAEGATERATLYLNAKSSLIKKLAAAASKGSVKQSLCDTLFQATKIFSGRMLDARQCIETFAKFSDDLEALAE